MNYLQIKLDFLNKYSFCYYSFFFICVRMKKWREREENAKQKNNIVAAVSVRVSACGV